MMRLFLSLHENWQYLNKHCLHRCSCVPSVFSCFELKAMHVLWTLTQIQDFIFLMQWNKMVSKGFYTWKLSQNSFILVSSVQAKNSEAAFEYFETTNLDKNMSFPSLANQNLQLSGSSNQIGERHCTPTCFHILQTAKCSCPTLHAEICTSIL